MIDVAQIVTLLPWVTVLVVFLGLLGLCFKLAGGQSQAHQSISQLLGTVLSGPLPKTPAAPPPAPAAPPASGHDLSSIIAMLPGMSTKAPAAPPAAPAASSGVPPWFAWAQHEVGFHEGPDNTGIDKYISLAHCGANHQPWCAIFANAALEATGFPGTRSASSQSFKDHPAFVKLPAPAVGAITVFWRGSGPNSGIGHVGFYVGEDATHVRTLGGNESDMVKIEDYPKSSASFGLEGYYWPKSATLPAGGAVVAAPIAPAKTDTKPAAPSGAPDNQSNIVATVFSGPKSAYGPAIDDTKPGVALPFRFASPRPQVAVMSRANGRSVVCEIVDIGPWNINDPYWQTGARPQAESGMDLGQTTGGTPRKTNKAGIDLTAAAAEAIQLDGKGLVDWMFVQSPASNETPKVS